MRNDMDQEKNKMQVCWSPPTPVQGSVPLFSPASFTAGTSVRDGTLRLSVDIQDRDLAVHESTTRTDVNKGGGMDRNKGSHLTEESEACWVIKEGR